MTTHYQVAQRWAERATPEGDHKRDLRGHHMFTAGSRIYSYGFHHLIAQWYELHNGERIVLFNTHRPSISTSKHHTITRRSLGYSARPRVFTVPFNELTLENVKFYNNAIETLEDRAKRAWVNGPRLLQQAATLTAERDAYLIVLKGEGII